MTSFIIILAIVVVAVETIRLSVLGFRSKKLAKETMPATQKAKDEVAKILIVGDSLAYGTGASKPENSLVGRLAKDYTHCTFENRSENGASIKRVMRQLEAAGDQKYTFVIICVGGIDTVSFTRINKVKNQLDQLYQQSKKISAGGVIHLSVNNTGLVPMFRFPLNLLFSYRSQKIANLSQSLSREHQIINVPLYANKDLDPLKWNPRYYAYDKIHPNDQGYEIWYKNIVLKATEPHLRRYTVKSKPNQ